MIDVHISKNKINRLAWAAIASTLTSHEWDYTIDIEPHVYREIVAAYAAKIHGGARVAIVAAIAVVLGRADAIAWHDKESNTPLQPWELEALA